MLTASSLLVSREGLCAVSVPAYPHGTRDDDDAMHAIFSMYEPGPASVAAAPGGVAAAAAMLSLHQLLNLYC